MRGYTYRTVCDRLLFVARTELVSFDSCTLLSARTLFQLKGGVGEVSVPRGAAVHLPIGCASGHEHLFARLYDSGVPYKQLERRAKTNNTGAGEGSARKTIVLEALKGRTRLRDHALT